MKTYQLSFLIVLGIFALLPCRAWAESMTRSPGTVDAIIYDTNPGQYWTNPNYIMTQDDAPAVASYIEDANETHRPVVSLTDFNFDIPVGSTITGVEVSLDAFVGNSEQGLSVYASITGGANLLDYTLNLGESDTDTYSIFGGSSNMWGGSTSTLTPAVINNSNFGTSLEFFIDAQQNEVSIDHASITVHYTPPPTVTLSTGRGQCTGNDCPQIFGACGPGRANANGTYEIGITFSESITGFSTGDITVTNGSVQSLAGSGDSYTATITSSCTSCLVEVSVAANVVTEGNAAAGPLYVPWGEDYFQCCDMQCNALTLPPGYEYSSYPNQSFIDDVIYLVTIIQTATNNTVAELNVYGSSLEDDSCPMTVNQVDQQSLLHGFTQIDSSFSSYTLYIPKIAEHTQLRVCSGKTTIGCTSTDSWSFVANEAGTITSTNGEFDTSGITVSVADGYWQVSGLTGTSGQGEDGGEGSGDPIPFFPVWSIPIIGVIGWYVLKREGWLQA